MCGLMRRGVFRLKSHKVLVYLPVNTEQKNNEENIQSKYSVSIQINHIHMLLHCFLFFFFFLV